MVVRIRRVGETDWTFDGTWPYEPHWHSTPEGPLHYVDEGPSDGRPVVLVHGNPTWGYLFRALIPSLIDAGCRVIVPDHLGFGRSAKPGQASAYRLDRHAARFSELLETLELADAVLVPHDWGGPISLRWAAEHHARLAGLFVLNTLAHPTGSEVELIAPLPLRFLRAPVIGELLVQGVDAFKPLMFRLAIERPECLDDRARSAYRRVHRGWGERRGMLAFARQLPLRQGGEVNAFNARTEFGLRHHLAVKPARIVWGERDRVVPVEAIEAAWLRTLPEADVVRLEDAGHFLTEDAPGRVIAELRDFIDRL